jgi:uncharacterized SAM-dependent methyltransferase
VRSFVELGPGNGEKLAALVAAAMRANGRGLTVHLVDISPAALAVATRTLTAFPRVTVVTHEADYESGLADILPLTNGGRTMALCLGSNIGNFDPPGAAMLLDHIRQALSGGDTLLIGTDLVKSEAELLLAYNDPLGVTAAFDRNLLVRANRELDADFDVASFAHRAVWNAAASRVEMQLVSLRPQTVRVPASHLEVTFAAGDTIWTESSYKFRPGGVAAMLAAAHFDVIGQWIDGGYAITLGRARAVGTRNPARP